MAVALSLTGSGASVILVTSSQILDVDRAAKRVSQAKLDLRRISSGKDALSRRLAPVVQVSEGPYVQI
jgi:hypothetical protein